MAYLTARTLNANQIASTLNALISQPLNAQVSISKPSIAVAVWFHALNMSTENDQTIVFDMDELLGHARFDHSYTGSGITALMEALQQFTQERLTTR